MEVDGNALSLFWTSSNVISDNFMFYQQYGYITSLLGLAKDWSPFPDWQLDICDTDLMFTGITPAPTSTAHFLSTCISVCKTLEFPWTSHVSCSEEVAGDVCLPVCSVITAAIPACQLSVPAAPPASVQQTCSS